MVSLHLRSFARLHLLPKTLWRFSSSGKHGTKPVLTLFTKKNEECSLCDEAKEVLNKYSDKFVYEEVYIDLPSNTSWFEKYRYDIPVLHLNGEYLMKHRVNERLLRRALEDHTTGENSK